MSNGKELWTARRRHQHLQNRRERPLIRKTGWGIPQKEERQRDRKREKELGRMDEVVY